ncbi:MAG: FRG domain-containing protein [Novosphingobium sp.]
MPGINTHEVSKLSEILQKIEKFQSAHQNAWFRGVGNHEHNLLPSIARGVGKSAEHIIEVVEPGIFATFAQRSPPFIDRDLSNPWRALFFIQHYGVPTRLLDWSESPFVAIYFPFIPLTHA